MFSGLEKLWNVPHDSLMSTIFLKDLMSFWLKQKVQQSNLVPFFKKKNTILFTSQPIEVFDSV